MAEPATTVEARVFDDGETLGAARRWLRQQAKGDGAPCPCCTQFTKIYRRGITSAMACALIRAWRAYGTGEEWHLPTLVGASGDTAKLVHWGLIAAISGLRDDGSPRNGWWRVTETGQDWVLGRIAVPRYVFLYDSRFLDFDGDGEQRWTVTDALGKKFDYEQLMTDPGTTDEAVF